MKNKVVGLDYIYKHTLLGPRPSKNEGETETKRITRKKIDETMFDDVFLSVYKTECPS